MSVRWSILLVLYAVMDTVIAIRASIRVLVGRLKDVSRLS